MQVHWWLALAIAITVIKPPPGSDGATPTSPSAVVPTLGSAPAGDDSDNHTFREDGRVYSVALIAATELPVGAEVLAQGRLARFG